MKFIQLTDPESWSKFDLRADLVEEMRPNERGGSFLRLTSGRIVECTESPCEVRRIVEAVLAQEPVKA